MTTLYRIGADRLGRPLEKNYDPVANIYDENTPDTGSTQEVRVSNQVDKMVRRGIVRFLKRSFE